MVGVGLTKYRSRDGNRPCQRRRFGNLRKKYDGNNAALDGPLGAIRGKTGWEARSGKIEPGKKCKP